MKTPTHQTSSRVDREIEAVIGRADAYLLATDLDLTPEQIRQRLEMPRRRGTSKNRRIRMPRWMDEALFWATGLGLLLALAALLMLLCGLVLFAYFLFRDGAQQYLEHVDVHRRVPDAATIIATITTGSALLAGFATRIAFWLGKRSGSRAATKPATDAKITQIHGRQPGSRTRAPMAEESSPPQRRATPGRRGPLRMTEDDDLVPLRRNSSSSRP
ncbi:hypothetical protein KGA66_26585 [Actinocrinis puniceicyclus]|uniref:Uncharacterized protein n=1 Tax=Actinocrinis puniceicyclus TaxID=977794 RepID=A0A8J7WVF8_9ACTN|nr:hypothetical protein [Actinocrinis puniceicyclus]MBS2966632.1 hypothetical protein [Actinocrinis puniceicyclus]